MRVASRPVDIWMAPLDHPREILIASDERARAARFLREADRVHWARARTALRAIVASYLDAGPLDFTFEIGPHGKPSVAQALARSPGRQARNVSHDVEFNLSHSGDWALIAVARAVPVGVDIEKFRHEIDISKLLTRLGETHLPDSTAALYGRWVCREAASKATGGALFEPVDPRVSVTALTAPANYAAAVALIGFVPEPVYRGIW